MKERPILFKGAMVRAILDGRKTQTRRIMKPQPTENPNKPRGHWYPDSSVQSMVDVEGFLQNDHDSTIAGCFCPHGKPGDRLWVRETWQGPLVEEGGDYPDGYYSPEFCEYKADGGPAPEFVTPDDELVQRWRPSIHMPRWASRITLEITGVRVERLQDISTSAAASEGLVQLPASGRYAISQGDQYFGGASHDVREVFSWLWESINGAGSWSANPWVWVVEFKRCVG